MKIGLSTASFFGKLNLEDTFFYLRKYQAETCEVFMTTYSEYLPEFGDLLVSRAAGIDVHSVHALNSQFEPQLFNEAERTRADAEKIFRMVLANGKKLGARYYTFHGAIRFKNKEYRYDYPALGARMNELSDIAAEYGVTVCFENVHWAHYCTDGFFQKLKPFCPQLAATLDIKQAFQSGIDWKKYLADMGRNVATIHVCDYTESGKLAAIGKGSFDFPEFFRVLREDGIEAPVLVELYAGDYTDFSEVEESLEYLKNLRG